jgi:enterochelin esterase family protein
MSLRTIAAVAALWCVAGAARADAPASPRLAAFAAKVAAKERGAEDAFWKQVTDEGTPMVEDVHDPKGRLLVTFLYRAKPDTRVVAMIGAPDGGSAGYARLQRLAGTAVFAHSALVDRTARFSYMFAPGDDLGAPMGFADFEKLEPLLQPDLLNKHPMRTSSRVELPGAPAQPLLVPHRETPEGEVIEYKVKSKALGNERTVLVYTPPGFSARAAPYPMVVMFDAETAITELGATIVLDQLIATQQIPPVIALLIGNADRGKELPGDPPFADFVALDLVPWVRRTYHATRDPRRTVIAGLSYGGIAAAFAAARHPAVYGNVLSQSGSYWWSQDDVDEGEAHVRDYAARPRLPLRFWMEVGAFESGSPKRATDQLAANRHMRDILTARGYEVSYREFAGAHEYISWRGTLGDGLVALLARPPRFTGAPPASPGKPGGIEVGAPTKTLLARGQRMALLDGGAATVAWLAKQDAALASEGEVNNIGYAVLELDHPAEAIALFEWNAQRFPASSNALDSLGDACWRAGDRARAITSFKRAVELDPKNEGSRHMLELLR